ncbi:MAG: tyrosine-type recombinase/integrase [Kiloniellales bacterium]
MGRIQVRHLVIKASGYYFQATPAMKTAGIFSESLGKDLETAVARAGVLNKAWDEIRTGREQIASPAPRIGTLAHLIDKLRASSEWSDKAPATIRGLEYALRIIDPVFGPTQLKAITPDHCRNFYDALRTQGSTDRAARVMKWLRYLFNFGLRYQLTNSNPALAVRIKHPGPRSQVWDETDIRAAMDKARETGRPCIALTIQIAYDTSLRQGDILALTWEQFDGESLWLKQGKTGKEQRVPLWPETVQMIEATRISSGAIPMKTAPIIRGPHGRRYLSDNFTHRFRDTCRAAGVSNDLQFLDIRRTASKERAEAGATEAELAAGTGHSIEHGSQILDTYNPRSYALAKSAQDKRLKNKKGTKV